jgi:heme exporter protein CcmD
MADPHEAFIVAAYAVAALVVAAMILGVLVDRARLTGQLKRLNARVERRSSEDLGA